MPEPRVLALGLGGAGNDLLTHLMDASLEGVYCVAADTDRYHLQIARAHSKLLMEDASCSDAGTAGDMRIGERVGIHTSKTLQAAFDGTDIVFILAGMGGGTGSGAAPVISDSARKNGALVVGLITKPLTYEAGKTRVAIDSLRSMLNTCDTVILLDNQSPESSSLTLPFGLNPDAAAQTCCSVVASITQTLANSNLLNGGLCELRAMLRRGGLARAGNGVSYSPFGAEEAVLSALRNTALLGDLMHASGVFVNIEGFHGVADARLECALELVSRRIDTNAELLYARRLESDERGITTVSLLATGVPFPYSWGGYRRCPIEIHELEPESGESEGVALDLGLYQLEDFPNL